jgi:hypothetical protein
MVGNEDISAPVQNLVKISLYDLNQRYEPQDGGKLTYFHGPER